MLTLAVGMANSVQNKEILCGTKCLGRVPYSTETLT